MKAARTSSEKNGISGFGFLVLVLIATLGGFALAAQGVATYAVSAGDFMLFFAPLFMLVALPLFAVEIALGRHSTRTLPGVLARYAGRKGEFVGWLALMNAFFLLMLTVAAAAVAVSLLPGAFGALWQTLTATPDFEPLIKTMPVAEGFFYNTLAGSAPIHCAVAVWVLLFASLFASRSAEETLFRILTPVLVVFLALLALFSLSLPNSADGIMYLFTPTFSVESQADFWIVLLSAALLSLMMGCGVVAALASRTDGGAHDRHAAALAGGGLRLFIGLLFSIMLACFWYTGQGSIKVWPLEGALLSVLKNMADMPAGRGATAFIYLLLFAVLSLAAAAVMARSLYYAICEKFALPRPAFGIPALLVGTVSSLLLLNPSVIDPELVHHGTAGLLLHDLLSRHLLHTGIPLAALLEYLVIGFAAGGAVLSELKIHPALRLIVRFVAPALIAAVLVWSLIADFSQGVYGAQYGLSRFQDLPQTVLIMWLGLTLGGAMLLTISGKWSDDTAEKEPPK